MATLQDMLAARTLTGVVNSISGGVPNDLLPAALYSPTREIEGDQGTYFKVKNTRKTARRAKGQGTVPKEADKEDEEEVQFRALSATESLRYKPHTLQNLMSEDGGKQRLGMGDIRRQSTEHVRRFTNLRSGCVYSALGRGIISFNAEGDLKTSASTINIDFGVPAGNKAQLDVFGSGDIISTSWDNAAADIPTQIKALKKAARKLTGLKIQHALYGENVLGYLLSNNQTKELINRSQARRDEAAALEVPNPFLGLTWWDVAEAFYDDAGTLTDFFGPDTIVFIPEVSEEWWDYPEGTNIVPTDLGTVHADAVDALSAIDVMPGLSSYATVTRKPVGIEQIIQDTFLPIIRNANAIFIATIKF